MHVLPMQGDVGSDEHSSETRSSPVERSDGESPPPAKAQLTARHQKQSSEEATMKREMAAPVHDMREPRRETNTVRKAGTPVAMTATKRVHQYFVTDV